MDDDRERVPLWFVWLADDEHPRIDGEVALATEKLYRVPPSLVTGYVARFRRDDVRANRVPESARFVLGMSDVSLDDAVRRAVARATAHEEAAELAYRTARARRRALVELAREYGVGPEATA